MSAGKPKRSTRVTAWLAILGTVGYVVAIAIALLTGCGPELKPAVSLHLETFDKTPRDASVTIDEQYVGPLGYVAARGVRLPVGDHRISVEKPGYFPFDELVSADRDDLTVKVKLEPVPD